MFIVRLALALAFALPALSTVRAGDVAELEILGFSADGKIFAFEEYGVQDGSGFPYANRYYIDTETDKFLPGTPIRARIDNENATVADARGQVKSNAQSVISDDVLAAHRGHTAGFSPVTELSGDPFRMTVNPRPVFPPIDTPLEFRLEEQLIDAPDSCELFGARIGFRLFRVTVEDGARTQLIHEDRTIPSSRGCPLGYRIAAVETFYPKDRSPVFAVLIAMRTGGFEGPDYRYLAVTGRF